MLIFQHCCWYFYNFLPPIRLSLPKINAQLQEQMSDFHRLAL